MAEGQETMSHLEAMSIWQHAWGMAWQSGGCRFFADDNAIQRLIDVLAHAEMVRGQTE